MTDYSAIDAALRQFEPLRSVLQDVHVRHIMVGPQGDWSFEKLGRHRTGEDPVDHDQLQEFALSIGDHALTEAWSLRAYPGVEGATVLLERRPSAIVDRIPDEVLQALKKRARKEGVTVIAGPPGSGKSNVLLWATRHLADEPLVLVSEVPPDELPGRNVIHVTPPTTEQEHRNLQRLMRRAQNVSWDRVSGLEDVSTLLGGAMARRRVFTLDSSDTVATLKRFDAWRSLGYEANLDVLLQLTSSVIGRAEVLDLLVYEEGEWNELYSSSGSRLADARALGRGQRRKHAITRPGIDPESESGADSGVRPGTTGVGADAPTGEHSSPAPSPEHRGNSQRVDALRAGIRKRPGQPTQDFDGPNTIPVPEPSEATLDGDDEFAAPSGFGDDSSVTDRLHGDSSSPVSDEFEGFEEDDPTASGEIDLQGILARRERDDSEGMLPEDTRQYAVEVSEDDLAAGTNESSEPDEIIPGVNMNSGDTGPYNLENLKITRVEEIEEAEMAQLRAMREESLAESDSSSANDSGEYYRGRSVEIDDEDLLYETDEEWDDEEWDEDSGRTAVASSDAYDAVAKEMTGRMDDPPGDVSELLEGRASSSVSTFEEIEEIEEIVGGDGSEGSEDPEHADPDSATSPSVQVADALRGAAIDDPQEDTAEFSIGDKIRIIRQRLKGEEG